MVPHTDTPFCNPVDVTEPSIEWDPNAENEPQDIMDEIQLEKFIQVLQTAQQLAYKWKKEKAKITRRPRVYMKNAPRTKWRWQKARKEYQAAGGKFITDWFQRKGTSPPETEGAEMDSEVEGFWDQISDIQVMRRLCLNLQSP